VSEIARSPKPQEGSFMEKIRIISQKRVHGEVEYNDGEFAEIQTVGIDGMEKDLLLEAMQVHGEDTNYSCEHFQQKLPVGSWLDICTTIEVTALESNWKTSTADVSCVLANKDRTNPSTNT
jgi:hypothetical protein